VELSPPWTLDGGNPKRSKLGHHLLQHMRTTGDQVVLDDLHHFVAFDAPLAARTQSQLLQWF